jgi:carbamoylphosphate synthase large subunit
VLVINAFRWLSSAQAARTFYEAGAVVSVLCPTGHPLAGLPFADAVHHYSTLHPLKSLKDAITSSKPDMLVPCDDQIAAELHQLYAQERDDNVRALIARSLGDPENFVLFHSRASFAQLGRSLGVQCLETELVPDKNALREALSRFGFPAVLKIDGTSGGRGVAIVQNEGEANRAFSRLQTWPGILRALKMLLTHRDVYFLRWMFRGRKNTLSLQRYSGGRLANAAVACWEGKVLAAVLVEVLKTDTPMGPSTLVRVVRNPAMLAAVEKMAGMLKLSGLCGFDFILRESDGLPQLVELNPRATPTCHLIDVDGRSPCASLYAQLRGVPAPKFQPVLTPLTLFPRRGRRGVQI